MTVYIPIFWDKFHICTLLFCSLLKIAAESENDSQTLNNIYLYTS